MPKKKNDDVSKSSSPTHSARGKEVYILSIKRSIYKSLEIIGVYSNIYRAKQIVKDNFKNYNSSVKSPKDICTYSNDNWERSKKDARFYFYPLNPELTAYYQIIRLEVDGPIYNPSVS